MDSAYAQVVYRNADKLAGLTPDQVVTRWLYAEDAGVKQDYLPAEDDVREAVGEWRKRFYEAYNDAERVLGADVTERYAKTFLSKVDGIETAVLFRGKDGKRRMVKEWQGRLYEARFELLDTVLGSRLLLQKAESGKTGK